MVSKRVYRPRLNGNRSRHPPRFNLCFGRRVGLRKVDSGALPGSPRATDGRGDLVRWARLAWPKRPRSDAGPMPNPTDLPGDGCVAESKNDGGANHHPAHAPPFGRNPDGEKKS